jgi:hypothetical protein
VGPHVPQEALKTQKCVVIVHGLPKIAHVPWGIIKQVKHVMVVLLMILNSVSNVLAGNNVKKGNIFYQVNVTVFSRLIQKDAKSVSRIVD